jgi:hypothetical protein
MITETPPVQEALDELRAQLGDEKLDFAELVMLGAREKLRAVRAEQATGDAALKRLAEMVRTKTLPDMDVEAADEVKRLGLDPPLD